MKEGKKAVLAEEDAQNGEYLNTYSLIFELDRKLFNSNYK